MCDYSHDLFVDLHMSIRKYTVMFIIYIIVIESYILVSYTFAYTHK